MLTKIYDMPAGTVGFEAVGEVDDDDVENVLAPALRQWVAGRGKTGGGAAERRAGAPPGTRVS